MLALIFTTQLILQLVLIYITNSKPYGIAIGGGSSNIIKNGTNIINNSPTNIRNY